MTKEEMIEEAAGFLMEHGFACPNRTDLIFKIRSFMRAFGVGDRAPIDLINALGTAGLKIVHDDRTGPSNPHD